MVFGNSPHIGKEVGLRVAEQRPHGSQLPVRVPPSLGICGAVCPFFEKTIVSAAPVFECPNPRPSQTTNWGRAPLRLSRWNRYRHVSYDSFGMNAQSMGMERSSSCAMSVTSVCFTTHTPSTTSTEASVSGSMGFGRYRQCWRNRLPNVCTVMWSRCAIASRRSLPVSHRTKSVPVICNVRSGRLRVLVAAQSLHRHRWAPDAVVPQRCIGVWWQGHCFFSHRSI